MVSFNGLEIQVRGKRPHCAFFTLTQPGLVDGTCVTYLREMYGSHIYTPSQHDVGKAFGASFDSNVWPLQFFRKLTHTSELIFLERLLNLCPAVHHERAVTDDGFVKWLAAHHKKPGICIPVAFACHFVPGSKHEKAARSPTTRRAIATRRAKAVQPIPHLWRGRCESTECSRRLGRASVNRPASCAGWQRECRRGFPRLLRMRNNRLESLRPETLRAANRQEAETFALLFDTQDRAEGMRAFLEKRAAKFVGK